MITYQITSDASFNIKKDYAGWAFIAGRASLPKVRAYDRFTIQPQSPAEAELMAIGHAVNALQANFELKAGDTIIVNTDCRAAVHYLRHQAHEHLTRNPRLRALARVVYFKLIRVRGVRVRYRLVSEDNKYLNWCHYKSKL